MESAASPAWETPEFDEVAVAPEVTMYLGSLED
ncbi:pyrroloquinoline quinone precursor peptide PqqA [Amycolatopsis alkalitolerans]|uniref:Coenzyme PQQ synthesis protein A n=1 Tax=Amycolatopsis alkalitolerans TaxID=2547244 RepID=A0A5C4M175_9PSEU|nr:pyrroloquinoline quinone precursor peptide PqqA [Amycolatopsis alkalitolerans]TNC24621.1 pyrroloquinoline quinone precursor peptide PqqA [Amycolatopsis alkalitolerans]